MERADRVSRIQPVTPPGSRRVYRYAIEQFIAWYCSEPRTSAGRSKPAISGFVCQRRIARELLIDLLIRLLRQRGGRTETFCYNHISWRGTAMVDTRSAGPLPHKSGPIAVMACKGQSVLGGSSMEQQLMTRINDIGIHAHDPFLRATTSGMRDFPGIQFRRIRSMAEM